MDLFDDETLTNVGLADLSPSGREKLREHADYVLKLRVGEALLNAIPADSLREIGLLLQDSETTAAHKLFIKEVTRLRAGIVGAERTRLESVLREGADRLRAADGKSVVDSVEADVEKRES